ncbi:signal peptidase I [Lachnospiraceae bacterium C7]|nr:signal peptidase I [Lachnospiraceae bacterium C7]
MNAQEETKSDALEQGADLANSESKNTRILKELWSWIKTLAVIIVIALLINKFVIINATIPSGSMENTIMTGDRLIGFRWSYAFSDPKRGDIVIFKYPVDEKQLYIKRVIGLPGDTVKITDGKIYINNSKKPLDEDYLKEQWVRENDGYTFEVPENSYLMLGDNRNDSSDAREWARCAIEAGKASDSDEAEKFCYVRKNKIVGRAIIKYFKGVEILTNK